jgi:hypothetical protein
MMITYIYVGLKGDSKITAYFFKIKMPTTKQLLSSCVSPVSILFMLLFYFYIVQDVICVRLYVSQTGLPCNIYLTVFTFLERVHIFVMKCTYCSLLLLHLYTAVVETYACSLYLPSCICKIYFCQEFVYYL